MDEGCETSMVRMAQAGDRAAFAQLVEQHRHEVNILLLRSLHDYHMAQDATQETFVRAFHGLHTFSSKTSFRRWLLRIAHNVAVDFVRRDRRRMEVELPEPDQLSGAQVVRDGDEGRRNPLPAGFWNAIERLSPKERHLVWLRYGRGLSTDQVARECGMSVGLVKVSLYRTRKRLRKIVQGIW